MFNLVFIIGIVINCGYCHIDKQTNKLHMLYHDICPLYTAWGMENSCLL